MALPQDPIDTLTDLTNLLRLKEAKEKGVSEEFLRANGIISCDVAAAGLRQRGHRVEVFEDHEGKRLRILEMAGIGTRRRKRDQAQLFEVPKRED